MFKLILAALISMLSFVCFADEQNMAVVNNQTDLTYYMAVGGNAASLGISANSTLPISWNNIDSACFNSIVCLVNLVWDNGQADQNIASMFVNIPNKQLIVFVPLEIPGFVVTLNKQTNVIDISKAPQ